MPGPLILDRYRPLGTSGKGGSGTVQICWDTRIQRRVAIKRITIPETSPDGSIPGLGEARTGAMLKHPNIVSVIDFDSVGQEAYLIMEAVEGPTLSNIIDATPGGSLDLDVIAAVANAVGSALDFAHENAVLHLDIKPDNVLVDHSGIIKVTDFGISELAGSQGFGQASGGTIGYMPPEQIHGDDLDQRTDGFSLAVVVYEMLTGRNPYNARDINGSLRLMEGSIPQPVSSFRDDTDPELDAIMESAISPDPDERFETVLDMLYALEPFLGDPAAGVEKLRYRAEDEDEDETEELERPCNDLWGRTNPRTRKVCARVCSAVLCWWTAALGLVAMGILNTAYSMGLAVVVGIVGAIFPGIGGLAAMAFLGAGIIVNPALPTALGVIVIIAACAWWALAGRDRTAATNVTLATPALGLAWFTPLAPMLAGFTLRPLPALACSALQGLLAITLAAITGSASMQCFGLSFIADGAQAVSPLAEMLTSQGSAPYVWLTFLSWILTAVLMSALCSAQRRVLSIVSAFLGCAVLIGAQVLAGYMVTGAWMAPSAGWIVAIVCATVLVVVIGALGAPYRHKKEE